MKREVGKGARRIVAVLLVTFAGSIVVPGQASANPYVSMGDSTSTSSQKGEHSSYVDRLYAGFGSFAGFDEVLGADEHIPLAQSGQVLGGLVSDQLPAALAAIDSADDTKALTVAIGANDIVSGYPCFGFDRGCAEYRMAYDDMISQLRDALDQDPGVEFFGLLSYYNPYRWDGSGVSPEDQDALDRSLFGTNLTPDPCPLEVNTGINDIIFQAGSNFDAVVADPYAAFLAGGGSLLRDATHANAAGDLAIAEAFLEPVLPLDCNPPTPTCKTNPRLCPVDTVAPRTAIVHRPARKSTKRRAVLRFRANESKSRFQCSLKRRRFARCSSPRIYRKLRPGRYAFRVRAVDTAGNVDSTPARYVFRISRRKS